MSYTIKKFADLAGISTRTLRYYDQIGLLEPSEILKNGYRIYDRDKLLEMQQILLYREMDMSLEEIQLILRQPDFSPLAALRKHRDVLEKRRRRIDKLIQTVERTIKNIKGERSMEEKDIFGGFKEEEYSEEAKNRWGETDQFKESQRKWSSFSAEKKKAIKVEGGRIFEQMLGSPESKPADQDIQDAVERYYSYLNEKFYSCERSFLAGLAEMWVADPRFSSTFEKIRTGGAEFAQTAVKIYLDNRI